MSGAGTLPDSEQPASSSAAQIAASRPANNLAAKRLNLEMSCVLIVIT
jgi:hypothetical protein